MITNFKLIFHGFTAILAQFIRPNDSFQLNQVLKSICFSVSCYNPNRFLKALCLSGSSYGPKLDFGSCMFLVIFLYALIVIWKSHVHQGLDIGQNCNLKAVCLLEVFYRSKLEFESYIFFGCLLYPLIGILNPYVFQDLIKYPKL